MSASQAQAQAQALNAQLEQAATSALEEVDQKHLRRIARSAYACVVNCYDQAGTKGPTPVLEQCARNCQLPHQQSQSIVQQEVGQFQNRLNRAMQSCQDEARDVMKPGYEKDAKQQQKVEAALLKCMQKTVKEHIALLPPLKQRIVEHLKQLEKQK